MRIRLHFEDNKVHFKQEYISNHALELMILDNTDLYYGRRIRNEIEKLFGTTFAEEEKDRRINEIIDRITNIQKRF